MGSILLTSFGLMFTPMNLLYMTLGVIGGMMAGALPGLTATMAVALLVPFTFTMNPISGLVTLGAIYCGSIFGGAFSAILVNTPGTPSSIGTTFDGYPMTKKGEGEEAVISATFASAIGGLFGTVVLLFLAPVLARVALRFGPPEYFWISIFGLTIIASIASKSVLKGLAGGALGLLISTIGIAPIGGDVRFTFGIPALQGGVAIIVALIGFFCIPEILAMVGKGEEAYDIRETEASKKKKKGVILRTFKNVIRMPGNLLRSSIIGSFIGIIPGAGGNIANLVAYNEAQRASKYPEKFGTGIMDGVVATEAANNATVEGGLVPLLTLGIPGSPPAAIIFGALMLQGLRPGPELFSDHPTIVYAFILSFFVANILMFVIGLVGGKSLYTLVTKIALKYLVPSIAFLTILGSYAIRSNIMDVLLMVGFGIIAFILKELKFHPAPVVLGLILGPIAEEGLVQGLLMGSSLPNRWLIFFNRPLSVILILLCLLSVLWPFISNYISKKRKNSEGAAS